MFYVKINYRTGKIINCVFKLLHYCASDKGLVFFIRIFNLKKLINPFAYIYNLRTIVLLIAITHHLGFNSIGNNFS